MHRILQVLNQEATEALISLVLHMFSLVHSRAAGECGIQVLFPSSMFGRNVMVCSEQVSSSTPSSPPQDPVCPGIKRKVPVVVAVIFIVKYY